MFLEHVFNGKNDIGRWLAMLVILIIATQVIGLIPFGVTIFINLMDNPDLMPDPENLLDLTAYDIPPISGLALMSIPFILGLVTLLLLMKPIHERPILSVFTGGSSFRWKRLLWGCGVWLLLISIYSVFTIAAGLQKIEVQFDPESFISLILVSLLLLPFQACFQEVFFRGYLLQGFAGIFLNRWAPLFITAILFGLMHYFNPEVKAFGLEVTLPLYIWFGIFFGLCTLMDDGIELALGAHTINSMFLSIFFTQDSNTTLTPALFNVTDHSRTIDLAGMLILSLIFIYLAKKQFAWPEWRYLLMKVEKPVADDQESEFQEYEEYDEYEDDNN
jgi:uncharacterized protein